MNRELWLQRYKAQLRKHGPGLTFSDWTEQDDRRTYDDLTRDGQFPDDPEGAADYAMVIWVGEGQESEY